MDKSTGEIRMLDDETVQKLEAAQDRLKMWEQVQLALLPEKQQKELKEKGRTKIGRNDSCPCGSGKKFKKCCLAKVRDYKPLILNENVLESAEPRGYVHPRHLYS